MTIQEVFDKVVSGLMAQGQPSMSGRSCMYRDREGNKCAAGMLIHKYHTGMEFKNASDLLQLYPDAIEFTAETLPVVAALQLLHDGYVLEISKDHTVTDGVSRQRAFRRYISVGARAIATALGLTIDISIK